MSYNDTEEVASAALSQCCDLCVALSSYASL